VIVAENSGRRKISKPEAIIKRLVNRLAKADWRAIKILLDIVLEIENQTAPEPRRVRLAWRTIRSSLRSRR
jgi:hypothetical protein